MENKTKNKNITKSNLQRTITILVCSLFFLPACFDLVSDLELPDSEPKIVVHSFISPADTAVMVLLTWSNSIKSVRDQYKLRFIANATVNVGEKDGTLHQLTYFPDRKIYSISTEHIPVIEGKSYVLTVELPDGQKAIAECRVPGRNESIDLKDVRLTDYNDWEKRFQVEYSFTDPGESETYYFTSSYIDMMYYDYYTYNWVYYNEELWVVYGSNYIHADGKSPKTYIIKAETYIYEDYYTEDIEEEIDEAERYLKVLLIQSDEHYYRYHKDLEFYYPDDPFSEPIHVYSNVEGGLGVFAGYNKYIIEELMDF